MIKAFYWQLDRRKKIFFFYNFFIFIRKKKPCVRGFCRMDGIVWRKGNKYWIASPTHPVKCIILSFFFLDTEKNRVKKTGEINSSILCSRKIKINNWLNQGVLQVLCEVFFFYFEKISLFLLPRMKKKIIIRRILLSKERDIRYSCFACYK